MNRRFVPMWLLVGSVAACRDPAPTPTAEVAAAPTAVVADAPRRAWGESLAGRAPELERAELQRDAEGLNPATSDREAWAVARIGDTTSVPALLRLLDGEAGASSAQLAALAFLEPPPGQPSDVEPHQPWGALEDAVWSRLAVTQQPDEAEALFLAVARVGGPRSQRRLAAELADASPTETEPRRQTAAFEAVGMLCARQFPATAPGLEAMAAGLLGSDALATAAAYAVGRCAGPSAELLAGAVRGTLVQRLEPKLVAADPLLTRRAWKAIGGLGEVPAQIPGGVLGSAPPPWQVEVEAVRALVGHADGRAVAVERIAVSDISMWTGARVHVLLEALRGLRDAVVGSPELLQRIESLTIATRDRRSRASGRRLKELALIDCEIHLLASIGSGDLGALQRCARGVEALPSSYSDVLAVESILRMGAAIPREDKARMLLERVEDRRSEVAAAAVAALVDVDDARISGVLRAALVRDDPGLRAAAATAIATRSMDRSRRDELVVSSLVEGVGSWPNATAIEAKIAAIGALGHLARSRGTTADQPAAPWLASAIVPLAADPAVAVRVAARDALRDQPELVEAFDVARSETRAAPFDAQVHTRLATLEGAWGLELSTSAGSIQIRFEGAAPINQAALVSLAAEGFFDGLSFHRVVPGFVVQGGDPRGDGYGGPGFLVPCERSNQKYERGVVGMALAGKDTGGSQFFIAHDREPRLDARYTIVGRVVEGLDVLDAILPHDRITKVEVLRGE